jgi:hypothetical protein
MGFILDVLWSEGRYRSRTTDRSPAMQADHHGPDDSELQDSIRILIDPEEFAWLTKQCQILSIGKQELISNALHEWLLRNSTTTISLANISRITELALQDFIFRHYDEFVPVEEEI